MKREHWFFVRDILEAIEDIERFVGDMTYAEFSRDKKTRSAVVWKIETIGEASKHIPKEVKARYKELPWRDMAGIRDKIAHFYFGVSDKIIWEVVKKRLPAIKPAAERMLKDMKAGRAEGQ